MTQVFKFLCDRCDRMEKANWNGEHWLPPQGWIEMIDGNNGKSFGHLCQSCAHYKQPQPLQT